MAGRARQRLVSAVAARTYPHTGRPYGRERAEKIVNHAATKQRDPQLEAGRRRRLLAQLDRALAQQGVKPPPKKPARPAARTEQARHTAQQEHADALRSWKELRTAIRAEGSIRPNRDYAASEIPRELRARQGMGKAPDEMAQVLGTHGLHYEGDVELFAAIEKRRSGSGRHMRPPPGSGA